MALLTMRFAGKFLAAQMCSHAPSTRSLPLSKAKRWLATLSIRPRPHLCHPFSAYMTQTTEHVVMQPHAGNPTIYLIGQNSRVVLSASNFFSSTKKGARGWNIKPYTLCIECYRTQKRQRRHLSLKMGPSPPEPGLQTLGVTSPADPQLSSVRTNHRPVSRHRPNKCNTPLSAVHRNATMQGPHYIFKDGQWATADMREHPKVQVTILVDRAQAHGQSISVRATNVTAIADTGAQVNVWSLDEFVKYGFPHDILTPVSNLVAANHSSISIVGAFFAIIEGLSCHGYVVQCRAMVCVSADIQTLFLSHGTLSTRGSCPAVSRHWANMLMLRRRNALVNLLPSLMRTSRALSLVAALHWAIKIILALALNVLPCHHPHGRYHFSVLPK